MTDQSMLSPESPAASAPNKKLPISATDHSLILTSLDAKLATLKSEWRQKHSGTDHNSAREAFYFSAMDAAINSLKADISNNTTLVDEADVEKQFYAFSSRYLSIENSEDESTSSDDEEENEQDISFDDDQVLDTEAYDRVRELRAKSREVASKVIAVREEGLERALGVTEKSLRELLRVHGFQEEEGSEDTAIGSVAENVEINKSERVVEPLNAALRNLTTSLQNVDSGLFGKLESIKETIGTIDSAVDKYQRVSQGDENILSQTEKALIAASTIKERAVDEESVGEETMNDPDRNLARMLAGL